MELTIQKIGPAILTSFLKFFDNIAFQDNPDWGWCYCHFYHYNGSEKEWLTRNAKDNRMCAISAIETNEKPGFLAFDGAHPIAWVNAGPKRLYPGLKRDSRLEFQNDPSIIAIVCFLIAPDYRRQGVASKMLKFIENYYSNQIIEAYPHTKVTTDAAHYHGPLELFKKAGFIEFKKYDDVIIVRKIPQ